MTGMDLTEKVLARVSKCAKEEIALRSKAKGQKPGQWVRDVLYGALRLTPAGEKPGPPRGRRAERRP